MISGEPAKVVAGAEVPDELYRLFVDRVRDYAMFFLDRSGVVASWNDGAEMIKGYAPHEIIGKHFSIFYPTRDVESRKPIYELQVATRDGRYEEEGWRVRKDGTMFWASVVITAIKHVDGSILGFAKVTRDLTERKHAEAAIRESEEGYRVLLDHVPGYAIFMLDPKGRVRTWTESAQRVKGYTAEQILGQHFSIFYTPEDRARGHPEEVLAAAQRDGHYREESTRVRADGTRFPANVTIAALRDTDGGLRGFVKITRDLSAK